MLVRSAWKCVAGSGDGVNVCEVTLRVTRATIEVFRYTYLFLSEMFSE